jgi:hypothetical protein
MTCLAGLRFGNLIASDSKAFDDLVKHRQSSRVPEQAPLQFSVLSVVRELERQARFCLAVADRESFSQHGFVNDSGHYAASVVIRRLR